MKKYLWIHTGGGTGFGPWRTGKYASDDSFENTKTNEHITIDCTTNSHFAMPEGFNSLAELLAHPGVDKKSLRTYGVYDKKTKEYIRKSFLKDVDFVD